MNSGKIFLVAAAAVMCLAVTGCSSSDSSSASSKTTAATTTTTTAPAATTDYDVNGDFRAFEQLKETYKDGYTLNFVSDGSDATNYTMCIKGDIAYAATVVSGMKSYRVAPGDGKLYVVSEATTTYKTEDASADFAVQSDVLFGATTDFDKAEIDASSNIVSEYYNLDEKTTNTAGQIVYGFDGETYELKTISIQFTGRDAQNYTVSHLDVADETLLAAPDLSGYTAQ